jgi:hypothetical protein
MSVRKEAVVFVPALTAQDKDFYLDLLSAGFTEHLESTSVKVKDIGEAKTAGNSGKRFELHTDSEKLKIVDVYEAYWGDLFSKLSDKDLKTRLLSGTSLTFYWFLGKIWASAREAPALFIGVFISLMFLIFWYYGIIVMALTAIGQDNNFFGFPIDCKLATKLGQIGTSLGGWSVWLIASALLNIIPVNIGVDIANFTKKYLDEDTDGRIIRVKTRQRISVVLNDILNENIYDKVTILAHSFGVTIATDLLADYHNPTKIRYISMGGALKVLSYKAEWIEKEIEKCLNNDTLETWIDFYSDRDWMCTKTPLPKGCSSNKIQYRKINLKFSLLKQMSGESHNHYFTDENVLKTILNI